jgi:hypothetical protein
LAFVEVQNDRAILTMCASNAIGYSVQGLPRNCGSLRGIACRTPCHQRLWKCHGFSNLFGKLSGFSKPACHLNEMHGMENDSQEWNVFAFLIYCLTPVACICRMEKRRISQASVPQGRTKDAWKQALRKS